MTNFERITQSPEALFGEMRHMTEEEAAEYHKLLYKDTKITGENFFDLLVRVSQPCGEGEKTSD